jgi:hypothetical protein
MFTRENHNTGTRTIIDHIFTDTFEDFFFEFALDSILRSDHKALFLTTISNHNICFEQRKKIHFSLSCPYYQGNSPRFRNEFDFLSLSHELVIEGISI